MKAGRETVRQSKRAGKSKRRILYIEDNPSIAEVYKIKLESEGFEVIVSPDGKEGIRAIYDLSPDLVLLDILTPQKDGFDVLSEINKNRPNKEIIIIVLTNLASPFDQEEGKRLGARDWWIKSFNTPSQVAEKVNNFFKKSPKRKLANTKVIS